MDVLHSEFLNFLFEILSKTQEYITSEVVGPIVAKEMALIKIS